MASVTQRIKQINQPYGGYLKPSMFKTRQLNSKDNLYPGENINPGIVGMAVDYLTRFILTNNKEEAFKISLDGAVIAQENNVKNAIEHANKLLGAIKDLDDESIVNACALVGYDVWFRNTKAAILANNNIPKIPDSHTIENIRIMVKRSLDFFEQYGPITKNGFTFQANSEELITDKQNGGYTLTVDSGDGDFLTKDTLWDFKVSKNKLKNEQTLQLLMYWIMGQHSQQNIYKNIDKLGIYNPRLNVVYLLEVDKIPQDIIKAVEDYVICY